MGYNATKYANDYNGKNYDRYNIMLPKGSKEVIKQYCLSKGISVNQLISNCILWELGCKDWKQAIKNYDTQE